MPCRFACVNVVFSRFKSSLTHAGTAVVESTLVTNVLKIVVPNSYRFYSTSARSADDMQIIL